MLVICRSPFDQRSETQHIDAKWCFKCRKRHIHTWTVLSSSEPGYYDPLRFWACANCGEDHTGFPGTEWWYGDE